MQDEAKLATLRQELCKPNSTRCTGCGFRIRGTEHESGAHHKGQCRRKINRGKK